MKQKAISIKPFNEISIKNNISLEDVEKCETCGSPFAYIILEYGLVKNDDGSKEVKLVDLSQCCAECGGKQGGWFTVDPEKVLVRYKDSFSAELAKAKLELEKENEIGPT